MSGPKQTADALAARCNDISEAHVSGNTLTGVDVLNIVEAIASDPDFAILFDELVKQMRSNLQVEEALRRIRP